MALRRALLPLLAQRTTTAAVLAPGAVSAVRAFGALAHPPDQSVRPSYDDTDLTHTAKWLNAPVKSPLELIAEVEPIAVTAGNVVNCTGGKHPSLGHPNEYIVLNDTSKEFPAVCKYCGLRYYMDAH